MNRDGTREASTRRAQARTQHPKGTAEGRRARGEESDPPHSTQSAGEPRTAPLLANIYLHYALDLWFTHVVCPRCQGTAKLIRFADDYVVLFTLQADAERFANVLPARLAKFGLSLAEEKMKLIPFGRRHWVRDQSYPEHFDLLGFAPPGHGPEGAHGGHSHSVSQERTEVSRRGRRVVGEAPPRSAGRTAAGTWAEDAGVLPILRALAHAGETRHGPRRSAAALARGSTAAQPAGTAHMGGVAAEAVVQTAPAEDSTPHGPTRV